MNKNTKITLGVIGGILACGIMGMSSEYDNTTLGTNTIPVVANVVTQNTLLNKTSVNTIIENTIEQTETKETNTIQKNNNSESTTKNDSSSSNNKTNSSNKSNNTAKENVTSSSEKTTTDYSKSTIVYITNTGEKYHRSGCSSLRKSKIEISLDKAKKQGYSACSRCDP